MKKVPTEVAVAVAFDEDGRFLMSSRPEGKVYAGYWEFPGGKVEAGETIEEALAREMKEELSVAVFDCREVLVKEFTYPHDTVLLHFLQCRINLRDIEAKEGQTFGFFNSDQLPSPILPATEPIIEEVTKRRV